MRIALTVLLGIILLSLTVLRCSGGKGDPVSQSDWVPERNEMIRVLMEYGIRDQRVLQAMLRVRRHAFIPSTLTNIFHEPYGDHPCPIGYGQTISQPYIVAYMTEKMNPQSGEKVLEIGTGSGYQAAILAELGAKIYSIEIVPELASHARDVLQKEGIKDVQVLTGDGYKGWPEHAPFDIILVTCAPEELPQALVDQLKEGGRMILPLGPSGVQRLVILRKIQGVVKTEDDLPVRFVPMVHPAKAE